MLTLMTYCAWFLINYLAGAGLSYSIFVGTNVDPKLRRATNLKVYLFKYKCGDSTRRSPSE